MGAAAAGNAMVQKVGASWRFRAQPGAGPAVAEALATLGEAAARRAGTELWLVHRLPEAPDDVMLWEVFASPGAEAAHRDLPAVIAALASIQPRLLGPPEATRVTPFAGKGLVAPPGD